MGLLNLFRTVAALAGLAGILCLSLPARAGVSLGSTRLVITAPQGEGTVEVRNEGTGPVLLQMWLDLGDPAAAPEGLQVPLIVEPPVLRLEAGRQQGLRLLFTGRPAPPSAHESLYWLNVQEVPVLRPAAAGNQMQVAFRTRIKVMYRPSGVGSGAGRAWAGLQARLSAEGASSVLSIFNPGRVHVSMLGLWLQQVPLATPPDGLLKPGAEWRVTLGPAQAEAMAAGAPLHIQCIDDLGNLVPVTVPVLP